MSEFQLNFFTQIEELFIDGTIKIAPKNWYQVLNIFGYNKKINFYMPLAYVVLNSKSEEIYNHIFQNLVYLIKTNTNLKTFNGIKIMSDFKIGLRKSIKKNFDNCLLEGCFSFFKSNLEKNKKIKVV